MELASHGYIVFVIWHNDGSCVYTETKDGKSIYYDTKFQFYDLSARQKQVHQREKELSSLLDEILEPNFLQETLKLPSGVSLDSNKVAASGHSFGGVSAIGFAMNDDRVKVCLPMDPWLFPYSN